MGFTRVTTALILGLSISLTQAVAIDISAVGGMTLGNATITGAPVTVKPDTGVGGGVLLGFPLLHGVFGLELGALYLSRKMTLTIGSTPDDQTMNTVQIPLLLRLYLLKFLSVGAGGYYWFGKGTITDTASGTTTNNTWSGDGYLPHDYGVEASVTLFIPVVPRLSLRVDGRYLMGMTNISTLPGVSYKTGDIQILGGLFLML